MKGSKIEWTDHTFNPWIGCAKVSPGCLHCYAENCTRARVLRHHGHETWGKGAQRSRTSTAYWQQPLKWNKDAEGATTPPRVFCASLADWLDDEVPIEWFKDLLELIHKTPHLNWLLLTKRPQNWRKRLEMTDHDVVFVTGDWVASKWLKGSPPPNVWLGTTVEDQQRANERIPELLNIPARARFLSCEPLLGPVNLRAMRVNDDEDFLYWPLSGDYIADGMNEPSFNPANERIHWVICGGESGPGARPMHPDWARGLRDQCRKACVPFHYKQCGEWAIASDHPDGRTYDSKGALADGTIGSVFTPGATTLVRVGKKRAGRSLDGRTWDEFPILSR